MRPLLPLALAVLLPALVAPAQTDKYADEFKTLRLEFQTRQRTLTASLTPTTPRDEMRKIISETATKLKDEFGPKFTALAKKAKGTPAGLGARIMNFQVVGTSPEAFDELVATEAKNPDMARYIRTIVSYSRPFGPEKLAGWLGKIEAETPYDGVKAELMLQRSNALPGDEGLALTKELIARYPTTAAATQAKAQLFEKENLQIGKVAPELTSTDETGAKITLSEYKGKVVVLDFWGFW